MNYIEINAAAGRKPPGFSDDDCWLFNQKMRNRRNPYVYCTE